MHYPRPLSLADYTEPHMPRCRLPGRAFYAILPTVKPERTRHIKVPPSERLAQGSGDGSPRTVRLPEADAGPPPAAAATAPAAGADLYSLYAIQSKIGDGGMGVVYLARDRRLDRFVAIKRLNQAAQNNVSLRRRFLQEARAVAALNHIHIVHIYALGEDEEGPYIVMEYVAGPAAATGSREMAHDGMPHPPLSLDRQVTANGQYTVNEAIDLLVKISKAIAYAHSNGVIHRDLKPSNILLDETGEPKIVDFGLARLLCEEESKLTVPGEKLLSLGYGAPEQEHDASVADHRADIYGLGALLYFAITGQNPRFFREQDIPLPLREVLVKALAPDREQRWSSATEFLEALHAVQSRTRVEQPTAKTTWRCKWCDTVNPLTIRFCSECGWDGSESCPECGAERFVSVQFCGSCGADARLYETIDILIRRMQSALEAVEFERVIGLASRAQDFEPAGPTGRGQLKRVQQLRDEAQRQTIRRDQLRELIPMEMRAENYERAQEFMREFRVLSGNNQLFADQEKTLPELRLRRDIKRARRACHDHEWNYALRLCDDLLASVAPDNAECLALRRSILRRRGLRHTGRAALVACGVVMLYLLALPLLARLFAPALPPVLNFVWRPALRLYEMPRLGKPLNRYARLLGVANLPACFAPATPAEVPPPRAVVRRDPEEMLPLLDNYTNQLQQVANDRSRYEETWPVQYLLELETLMERRRTAGDFEAWSAINTEHGQFARNRVIGPITENENPELTLLKRKYRRQADAGRIEYARRIVAATKKYLNDLTNLQSTYTRDGRMREAAFVNNEIRRVRSAPGYLEAETFVAEIGPLVEAGKPVTLPPGQRLDELQPLRQQYEEQLAATESDFTRQQNLWPEKYLEALNKLLLEYQSEGDFTGWESTRNEIDRFEMDQMLLPGQLTGEPSRLHETQRQHLMLLQGYREARARGIINLAERYIKTLTGLQSKYTKAGDMAAAGEINAEIRRIRNAPEVLAAQTELAPPPAAATNGTANGDAPSSP
jgi:serine/threonine protein kinase